MKKLTNWMQQAQLVLPSYLLDHYKEIGLNDQSFMLLIHLIHFNQSGNLFPTPAEFSTKMSLSEQACKDILFELIKVGCIRIVPFDSDEGIHHEQYDITPLYDKIAHVFALHLQNRAQVQQPVEENLYPIFEQEFGRPLSPFEAETLSQWIDLDKIDPALIKLALKEAVISSAFNFRYIERILYDWKQRGIRTVEQARAHSEKFRSYKKSPQQPVQEAPVKSMRLYNWLEE